MDDNCPKERLGERNYGQRSRPKASLTDMANVGILLFMVLGAGVSIIFYMTSVDSQVKLLDNKVSNMQYQISEMSQWIGKIADKLDAKIDGKDGNVRR